MRGNLLLCTIPSLLSAFLCCSSCNGQVKTNTSINNSSEQKTITNKSPKMIKNQGTFSYMTHTGPRTDKNVEISSIIEDKAGNLWIATMGEGVYCYDGKSFRNYTVRDGLITNVVYSIMEDKEGNLWFGTINGTSLYNKKGFTNFPFSVIKGASPSLGLETNAPNGQTEVWSLLQDKNGKIWLGTTSGVYRYDGTSFTNIFELGIFTSTVKSDISTIRAIPAMMEDKKGTIWFTSWFEGLCRFDGERITSFKTEGLLNNDGLLQDKTGDIWIAERGNGVNRYNGKTFARIFPGVIVTEMQATKNGNIWFSTFDRKNNSGSVLLYNPSTGETIVHFTAKEIAGSNNVTSIAIDKSGNAWFGTNEMTLVKYDGKTFTRFLSE